MAKNEEALKVFCSQIDEIKKQLTSLQTFTDDHMGFDFEGINWNHVGTAGHYLKQLTELTDMAFGRGEYRKVGAA